jgi:hypothetical protein
VKTAFHLFRSAVPPNLIASFPLSGGDRKAQAKVIRYRSGVHSHRILIPKGLQPRVSQFVRASM